MLPVWELGLAGGGRPLYRGLCVCSQQHAPSGDAASPRLWSYGSPQPRVLQRLAGSGQGWWSPGGCACRVLAAVTKRPAQLWGRRIRGLRLQRARSMGGRLHPQGARGGRPSWRQGVAEGSRAHHGRREAERLRKATPVALLQPHPPLLLPPRPSQQGSVHWLGSGHHPPLLLCLTRELWGDPSPPTITM